MALKVWLPLNKDTRNVGLFNSSPIPNSVELSTNGIFTNCYKISNDVNSYINANVKTVDLFEDNASYSVAFWVKLSAYPSTTPGGIFGTNKYMSEQTTGNYKGGGFGVLLYSDNIRILHANSTTNQSKQVNNIPLNTWLHIAICYNNDGNIVRCYVNGEKQLETTFTINYSTNGSDFIVGRNTQGGCTNPSEKYINDFRIYDNCLSEEDVKRLYQQKLFELVPYSGVKDVLFDRSGLMNMPLVNNGADFQTNCLYFDGTNDQLRPKVTNDGFNISGGTLSIWFAPTEKPNKNILIYTDEKSHMSIGFSSTGNSLIVRCGTSNGNTNCLSTTGISWGSLNNVIVTYNNTMPQICLINGIVPSVYTTSTGFTETAGKGLTIGGRQYNTTSRFDGKIYKVAVYNKQFTQDEAVELYNSEKGMFLPDDYIQLEYAQSDGNQYINTEIYTTNSTNLEVTVKTNNNGSHLFFGYFENATNAFQFAQSSNGNCFICDIGNTSNRIVSNILGTSDFHILLEKNKSFYIDGKLIGSATNASIPTNKIIHLFKSSYYTGTSTSVKIKNAKIWNDNILVRNFIPAKRKSDNVIGMYDMVSMQFFTNSGSGSFTGA